MKIIGFILVLIGIVMIFDGIPGDEIIFIGGGLLIGVKEMGGFMGRGKSRGPRLFSSKPLVNTQIGPKLNYGSLLTAG